MSQRDRSPEQGRDLLGPVERFYQSRNHEVEQARKVSWRSVWGQEYRFEVLCEIFDRIDPAEPFSVLDVGCGLGDLAAYLRRRGHACRYLGVDILPEMVEGARARFPGERFEVLDILQEDPPGAPFDFVLASGALSVKVEEHEDFVHAMIARMLELSRKGLAFNMQSARARARHLTAQLDTEIYYADPLELYGYCRDLCPRTVLREDFMSTDFAIFLFPGATRSHRGYQHWLRQDPPREDWARGMAFLYLDHRLPEEALAALEGAPESAEVLNYRGLCALHLGRPGDALGPLRRAVELDPLEPNAPVNLGVALSMLGDEAAALQVWRAALARRADNEAVRIKLAHALVSAGEGAEAYEVARGLKDESLRKNLQGLARMQEGQLEEARSLLEAVVQRNPDMAKARYELGQVLEMLEDEAPAADAYLAALQRSPEHRGARKGLRRLVLRRRGQGAAAGAPLRSVLQRYAEAGSAVAAALLPELDRA